MASMSQQQVLQALLDGNDECWSTFVFDVEKAKLLSPVVENDKEKAKALLGAGNDWNCQDWNTSIEDSGEEH